MLFFDGGLALVIVVLWLFCLFDVITTDALLCRNLPKLVWLFIVLLLPDVGSIIWLVAGHPWQPSQRSAGLPYKGNTGYRDNSYRDAGYRNRSARASSASNPDDDADFQRQLRERVEQQRRSAPRPPDEPSAG